MHPGARTTPSIRAEIFARVSAGESISAIARGLRISRPTVYKWAARGATDELIDRSSRPKSCPHKTAQHLEEYIVALRTKRRLFAWQIALGMGMARSTVIAVLRRAGLHRLRMLDLAPVFKRYEYDAAGDLVHIDIKKLARIERAGHRIHGDRRTRVTGAGWEHVYVCVDDATRLAFIEVRPREHRHDASSFLRSAIRWFASRGVRIKRVMTDNGKVFLSKDFQTDVRLIGARHLRTPIYTPRVNGKAERFIRTLLGECAYGVAFDNSAQRTSALAAWNRFYNEERPHSALNYATPVQRLTKRQ